MAVGINGNLTQLCKNTRKRPDKTSGCKCQHQRLDNVQVVAASDADDEVTAALHAAVSTATEQTVAAVPGMTTAASAVSVRPDILSRMRCGKTLPQGKADVAKLLTGYVATSVIAGITCCVHLATVPDGPYIG